MKKLSILMAGLALSATTAHADEGMWTLYNLPQAVYEQMQAEGFTLPYGSLYSNPDAIKNAVVNFSGYCSGVVVSPDGPTCPHAWCGQRWRDSGRRRTYGPVPALQQTGRTHAGCS